MLIGALTFLDKLKIGSIATVMGYVTMLAMLIVLIAGMIIFTNVSKKGKVYLQKFKVKFSKNKSNNNLVSDKDINKDLTVINNIEEIDDDTKNALALAIDMYMKQGENGKKHNDYKIIDIKKI